MTTGVRVPARVSAWVNARAETTVAAGYLAAWRLVRLVPERLAAVAFAAASEWATWRNGRGVRQLRANLTQVVGPGVPPPRMRRIVRAGMRSYSRYWHEAFRLADLRTTSVLRRMDMENPELLAAAHARGRGVVVALAHCGNWDHTGAWAAALGYDVTAVAQRARPEWLYQRFVAYRSALGIDVVPLTGGDRPLAAELTARLRAGGVVCLLADRDLSRNGVPVRFLGRQTRLPTGPALLSIRTGAPLLVCQLWYDGGRTIGRLVGPLEVGPSASTQVSVRRRIAALTQRMADALGAGIAAHPTDWHMLQPIWPGVEAGTRASARASARADAKRDAQAADGRRKAAEAG